VATQVIGTASISYTAVGGSTTTTVNLGTPLHDLKLSIAKERRVADPLDYSAREVVRYGDGRAQVDGLVRLHDNGQELVDLIENGLDGQVVTYKHGSTYSGIAARMVAAEDVVPDRERASPFYSEYETRFTLRRTTTGDWSAIL